MSDPVMRRGTLGAVDFTRLVHGQTTIVTLNDGTEVELALSDIGFEIMQTAIDAAARAGRLLFECDCGRRYFSQEDLYRCQTNKHRGGG